MATRTAANDNSFILERTLLVGRRCATAVSFIQTRYRVADLQVSAAYQLRLWSEENPVQVVPSDRVFANSDS